MPGSAKLADARGITTRDCRVEAAESVPFLVESTNEELRRLADLNQRSAALDKDLPLAADAADAAKKGTQLLVLPMVWDFRPDPRNEGMEGRWFAAEPNANWTKIRVDQPWTKQGHEKLRGAGWYAVTFSVPQFSPGHRIFLRLGAVNGTLRVWLDGKPVGKRTIDPAYVKNLPWALDLTGMLRPSVSQRLVVEVRGTSEDAGMIQPVELRLD